MRMLWSLALAVVLGLILVGCSDALPVAEEVAEAADGQEAVEACKDAMPDAVLLDWNMPVMNGPEFITALRQMPGGDSPVVVFCSTENDMAHITEALSRGANEYIMKPFDGDIIKSKFEQVGLID